MIPPQSSKAEDTLILAEKRIKPSGGLLKLLDNKEEKAHEAAELFIKAGNLFKIDKNCMFVLIVACACIVLVIP